MQLTLKIKKVKPQAKVPMVAHVGEDFGYDVFACLSVWWYQKDPNAPVWTVFKDNDLIEGHLTEQAAKNAVDEYNLYNCITLGPHEQKLIPTGIAVAMDDFEYDMSRSYEELKVGLIAKQSSGLALKRKLDVKSGVIDAGYRNEVQILLYNYGHETQYIRHQDKIGQLVPVPVFAGYVEEVTELPDSKRGMAGWGSGQTDKDVQTKSK